MSKTADIIKAHEADAFSALGEMFESAAETIGDFAASSRDRAAKAARSASDAVSAGVYKGAYGTSYVLVFGAVFLTDLLPLRSALRRGFEEGAHAALVTRAERRRVRAAKVEALEYRSGEALDEPTAPETADLLSLGGPPRRRLL
jgi:hypothetical protein